MIIRLDVSPQQIIIIRYEPAANHNRLQINQHHIRLVKFNVSQQEMMIMNHLRFILDSLHVSQQNIMRIRLDVSQQQFIIVTFYVMCLRVTTIKVQ